MQVHGHRVLTLDKARLDTDVHDKKRGNLGPQLSVYLSVRGACSSL